MVTNTKHNNINPSKLGEVKELVEVKSWEVSGPGFESKSVQIPDISITYCLCSFSKVTVP